MLLEVKDLKVSFRGRDGVNDAVKGVSFERGRSLAIVGESGSGKSVSALALTQLLPPAPQCAVSGRALLEGVDLLSLRGKALRRARGKGLAYVFQEPSTALNPYYTVGNQIAEAVKIHQPEIGDPWAEAARLLDRVGIRDAKRRAGDYPHQMSGGMKQRVAIAIAVACKPQALVADEPTTALDVTIEAQIMDLLAELRESLGMATLLITHNFGIVDGFADDVAVMRQGRLLEQGAAAAILARPRHPYTQALIRCIPRIGDRRPRLPVIDEAALAEADAER